MSGRPSRQSKLTAYSTGRRKSSRKHESQQKKRDAVVDIDPFLCGKNQNKDKYSPPSIDENDVKIEQLEGDLSCLWKVGTHGSCSKICESPDELLNHLLDDHAKFGNRGYVCYWKNCSKGSFTSYRTSSEFKDHLKFHTVISPFSNEQNEEIEQNDEDISADENYLENEEEGESTGEDSDYMDSSDEEYTESTRKRKSSKQNSKSPKKKKLHADTSKHVTPQQNITTKSADKSSSGVKELSPIALSFYRFTCMWVVPFTLRGRDSTQQQNVVCRRKFTKLEESVEHLQGHHVARVKNEKEIKCHWEGCEKTLHVFENMDRLREHVLIHTEETMLTFNNNLIASMASNKSTTLSQNAEKLSCIPVKNTERVTQATDSVSDEPTVEATQNANSTPKSFKENDSWMVSVLRLLISSKVDTDDIHLCPSSQLCLFCRFCSLKNRLVEEENPTSYSFYEFTLEKEKFKSFANKPVEFFDKILDDLISHESVCHNGKIFSESFWIKCLKTEPPSCPVHRLNENLINLFPVQYKNCHGCRSNSSRWPTSEHYNLIIKLAQDWVCYPDVLIVKGKVYQLTSVVCKDGAKISGDSYITYVRVKNSWMVYYEKCCNWVSATRVFGDKNACIVSYTLKTAVSNSSTSASRTPSYSFEDCKEMQFKICDNSVVDNFEPPNDNTSYIKPPLSKKMDEKLVSLFTCRQLINDGNESCINSVLQAILQTGLVKIVKELCPNTNRCYFCRMISFIQRAICSSKDESIRPYELSVYREELGLTEEDEGNPTKFIGNLISQIVTDEKTNHDSSDAKYTFMIRQKKNTCSCMMSCEVYHWSVTPKKKNESLLDLMADCSMRCAQCSILTTVQPIQMPDNLIITIENNDEDKDISVHYPDEWASYNTRYFLSSIIVADKKENKSSEHYYTYCKVFGKWMCYDDERITKASSSDVLGNKKACVLVYVTKELTPQSLQDALADAKCYSFKKKGKAKLPIAIKEEPHF